MSYVSVLQLVLIVVIGIDIFIAAYVLLKNPRRVINRAFFIAVTAAAVWGNSLILLSRTGHFSLFDKLSLWSGTISIFGFALFAKTFPTKNRVEKKFWLICIPFLILIVLIPFNLIIKEGIIHPDGRLEPINGPAFPLFVVIIGAYIIYSLYLLAQTYTKASGLAKLQLKYLFMGVGIFLTLAFVFDILLPNFGVSHLNFLGPMASIIFVGFTAYAIVRHQLMDIKIVIQRSLVYATLLVLVIGFYLILVNIIGFLLQQRSDLTILFSAGLTTIIGIFSVPHIEKYFRKLTDRIFFKDRYDYSEAMQELSGVLHKSIDLEEIIGKTSLELKNIFRVDTVNVLLTAQKTLPDNKINIQIATSGDKLTVPIVLDGNVTGEVVMGKKMSGDIYTREDLKLLKTFSYQAAIALERAKLYNKVKSHAYELEEKIKQRTAQIQQLQEEQKQIMIDISRGLQTPLTVIKGELGFLQQQLPNNIKVVALEKSVDEISKFIYDLLSLAKLETNTGDFKKEAVDLSRLLNNLLEYFSVLTQEKNIKIVSNIDNNVILSGKKDKLEELVINLFSNAVKYMPERKDKKIFISLHKNQNIIELMIEDNGAGISKENLSNIFNRFYRIKNNGYRDVEGTGLGLAICKKIAEKHNGTIKVESEPGKGARFVVKLFLF